MLLQNFEFFFLLFLLSLSLFNSPTITFVIFLCLIFKTQMYFLNFILQVFVYLINSSLVRKKTQIKENKKKLNYDIKTYKTLHLYT